jgi:hypothetical protein
MDPLGRWFSMGRGFPCKECRLKDCGNPYFHVAIHRTLRALEAMSLDDLGRLTEADFTFCPEEAI